MRSVSDVVVIGGGPCGSFAAAKLAKLGFNVVVLEEHAEIGVPSHCAGHLSISGLKRLGLYPLPSEVVENTFHGAVFHSPIDKRFSVRFESAVTCAVNRALFDKHLAEMAEGAGARYCMSTRAESLIIEENIVRGVTAKENGKNGRYSASIVIDAEGVSSTILRQAGLPALNRCMVVNGVEAEVENVEGVEPDMVEVFLGDDYAPGFYAWLMPKHDGNAKVGLAAKVGSPKKLLQKLMTKHPVASKKLSKARILQIAFHPITLGGPISKPYSSGFLAIGDAASQVKSTTGGGVIFGMTCAKVAAEVAGESLRRNDFSSEFLSKYQRRCEDLLGFDVKIMLRIRRMLNAMLDSKIDSAIDFCARHGFDNVLQKVRDIDFQGKSLLRAVRNPRMLPALLYFSYLYLSANL
jgi:digeranylgeranylglycerophospholipid reductase